jgi:hypothetical protein
LSTAAQAPGPLHIEVTASRTVRLRKRYFGGRQPLCFRLESIRIPDRGGASECASPRLLIPPPE